MARQSDLIFVLDNGRILEKGTHKTLSIAGSKYNDFYHKETGDDEAKKPEGAREMRAV